MNPQKLPMQSADGAQINLDMLYQIAPSCFTEVRGADGKVRRVVNFDVLRQLLGDATADTGEEFYQFTWPGKAEARREAARSIRKTLRPVPEDSVDWDTTRNLYIEGDNLEVLKLLQKSYMGKVKMIYIDPPYNTGNDFVYKDDRSTSMVEHELSVGNTDEFGNRYRRNTDSNGRFHSDWCSMIYPRLQLARNLLAEDGVVFISIDDCENYNMLKICNEVFGEENYVTSFAWVNSLKDELTEDTKFAGSNLGTIKNSHEYVLVYARCAYKMALDFSNNPYIVKLITNGGNAIQQLKIPKGLKCISPITKTIKGHVGGVSDYYDIITPEGMIVEKGILMNDVIIEGPLRNPVMLSKFFEGEKIIDNKGQELIDVFFNESGMLHTKKLRAGNTVSTVLVGKGTTKNGTLLLKDLFGETVFDYAKPVELINYLISKHNDKEFIILDFFSGSATTAHSVYLTNRDFEKKIKFILVQIQEKIDPEKVSNPSSKKIAQAAIKYLDNIGKDHLVTELAKERIRIAGRKIKEEAGLQGQNLDTGFRVFRVDESNMEDVYFQPAALSQDKLDLLLDNVKPDRTDLDLLFGAMLDWGVKLSLPMSKATIDGHDVYTVNDGDLVACFAPNITEKVIEHIADKSPLRVLFRDSCFNSDADKINIFEQFKQRLGWNDEEAMKNIRVI